MIPAIPLGLREFVGNWRRNAVYGLILFLAVATQLATVLSDTGSRTAVSTYGTAVFGYATTMTATVDDPLGADRLDRLNQALAARQRSYPWFQPATSVQFSANVNSATSPDPEHPVALSIRAVTPAWRLLSSSIPDNDGWRTVVSARGLGGGLLASGDVLNRLHARAPFTVALATQAPSAAADQLSAPQLSSQDQPATPDQTTDQDQTAGQDRTTGQPSAAHTLRDVPVYGSYAELNKSLSADALGSQRLLARLGGAPLPVSVYWRCADPTRCADAAGLVAQAAADVGTKLGEPSRVDQLDQFTPVLTEQARSGERFRLIVVVLGALAVTIVATAFVEVRAPQFATLRTLGATRGAVALIALLENVLTALIVAVASVVLAVAATRVDPDRFNQIPQVHLDHLDVPVEVYLNSAGLTLAIGLLTGLSPALRAYRSVRAS